MLKTIEEPIKTTRIESITDFVPVFNAEVEFEKEYGVDIDNWQNKTDDQTCIETILSKRKGLYRVVFVDDRNCGHFIIEEYEKGNQ